MKKTLLAAALLTFTATVAQAQSPSFGIKAGASLTNFVGSATTGLDYRNKVGFHGGFVAKLPLSDVFSIQPELLYSMKGYKLNSGDPTGNIGNNRETLHYIDVPVLARINAGSLFFEAGPQFGYLVAAKFTYEGSAIYPAGSSNSRYNFRKVDLGYAAGLGYQMPAGPGIGLRYNGGFKNIREYNNGTGFRNSAFQLYLSYMFGGK